MFARFTRLLAILAVGMLLTACASAPKEHVVTKIEYIIVGPNEINMRATPVPVAVMAGCDEKGFNARQCLNSRTLTADKAYTALGMCNADKAEIRKTLINLRTKHEAGK